MTRDDDANSRHDEAADRSLSGSTGRESPSAAPRSVYAPNAGGDTAIRAATHSADTRALVRVFLASSQDLDLERRHFEELVRTIGDLPNVSRQYTLEAVHWQQGGGDAEGRSVQDQIEHSVRFNEIPIVVVLVGSYVGPGTRSEYETARAFRLRHGSWPKVLTFFKSGADGVGLIGDDGVVAFHRQVISDGVAVPTNFRDLQELGTRLGEQVMELLIRLPKPDPIGGEKLRRTFFLASIASVALSVALLYVTQTMAFPDNNVSSNRVLFVLSGPPLLFVAGLTVAWLLARLQREFAFAWHCAEYADQRIYQVFRNLIPRSVIPRLLRDRFPRDPLGEILNWVMLGLILIVPLAAQYNCIFSEFLQWDFVVEPQELVAEDPNAPAPMAARPVKSRFVEHGPLRLPYGLRTPAVVDAFNRGGGPIYVYSPSGNLGDPSRSKLGAPDAYRMNMGPEVFLPAQPLIYLSLFVLQALASVVVLARLALLGRTVTRRRPISVDASTS